MRRIPTQYRLPHKDVIKPDLHNPRLSREPVEINGIDPTIIYSHSAPASKTGEQIPVRIQANGKPVMVPRMIYLERVI